MKLFLADGKTQTLVSRRPPTVSGPSDNLEFGSVVIVRLRQRSDEVGIPATANWRLLGRSAADYRVLTVPEDRDDLRRAIDATILTLDRWPALRRHLNLDDPSPTIATTIWELTGTLLERERVGDTWSELAQILEEIPPDTPIHAETADRVNRAQALFERLTADTTSRIAHLTKLADETEAFIQRQDSLARAREALRDADYLFEATELTPPADNARDLADHTTAVLTAYNELTR
ncbi:hypothetical protein [Actinoplanes sp. NPDC026619]|uniref:hypothetical protein n=1 Tax=Actinoplanes sp. NPDC026619 TaxID=3155798 RepID=UPI0033D6D6BB